MSILFAAFLGYNPIQHLLGAHVLASLPAASQAVLTGRAFFPQLIAAPFRAGLDEAFTFAIIACLIAAAASLLRGGKYHYVEEPSSEEGPDVEARRELAQRPELVAHASAASPSEVSAEVPPVPIRKEQHAH